MNNKLFLLSVFFCLLLANMQSQTLIPDYKGTWVGNTYGGKDGKNIQHTLWGMYVKPDGTVYGITYWDETGREVGVYKNGNVFSKFSNTHGWPADGIWGDDNYIYIGGINGQVRRYNHTGTTFTQYNVGQANVRGIYVSGDEMFISLPGQGQVVVKSKTNIGGANLRAFNIPNARDIVEDKFGNLWILQAQAKNNSNPHRILKYSKAGVQLPGTIDNLDHPSALAINAAGDKLYVSDIGTEMNIKIYTNLDAEPTLEGTFGELGGIQSGGPNAGKFGEKRFNSISSMGIDANDNLYVANMGYSMHARFMDPKHEPNTKGNNDMHGAGLTLESYNLGTGNRNWYVHSLGFTITGSMDIENDKVFHSPFYKYSMDWSENNPGEGQKIAAFTIDPNKYPNDFRIEPYKGNISTTQVWVRYIQGKKFLFMTHMAKESVWIYRFDEENSGDIAIPCAALDHVVIDGKWVFNLWIDDNGNGNPDPEEIQETLLDGTPTVDLEGNIWIGKQNISWIYHNNEFNEHGVPLYSLDKIRHFERPQDIGGILRMRYDSDQDIMYLSGYTPEHPNSPVGHWKSAGRVVKRYKNFAKGGNRAADAIIPLWWDAGSNELHVPVAWDIAGDYLFMAPHKATFSRGVAFAYEIETGKEVGYFKPTPEITGPEPPGWVDLKQGLSAHQRPNGEYVVCIEDNGLYKILIYRWCPTGDCVESEFKIDLLSPESKTYFVEGDEVTMLATVETDTSSIAEVRFYAGESLVATLTEQPYEYKTTSLPLGNHLIKAVAYSTAGAYKMAKPVPITVGDGKPEVKLISPNTISYYTILDDLLFKAEASDFNGQIDSVAFFINHERITTITAAPYEFNRVISEDGEYVIYCIAYDNDLNAASSDTLTITINGYIEAHDPGPLSPGLKYKYYEQAGLELVEDYLEVNLKDVGIINNFNLSVMRRTDDFVLIYDGYIKIPADDNYTFYTTSDDGSLLWIDTMLVVNNDGLHGSQERFGNLLLKQGMHPIRVGFFERGGGEVLQVRWGSSSIAKGFIPDSVLFRDLASGTHVPVVELSSNAVNDSILKGNDLIMTASVEDLDGDVFRVELYRGTNLSKIFLTAPYEFVLKNPNVGTYAYTAKVYDWSGNIITSNTNTVVVYSITNVDNLAKKEIEIYPNPVKDGQIVIKGLNINDLVSIHTLSGSLVYRRIVSGTEQRFDLSGHSGILIVSIQTEKNVFNYKVILQ